VSAPAAEQGIRPDKLLRDLADIWLAIAKPDSEDGTGVLRACSMTLIVVVDAEDDAQELSGLIAVLMRDHPSRAIVVRVEDSDDRLEGRVFAQCWKPSGHGQQICCEQIELVASLNRIGDVPSVISPIEAPDLPRVVWFRSERISEAADITGLLALGDKLIVDSSRPGAPSFADLRALASAGFVVGDLAWTRLTALRQVIAQLLSGRQLTAIRHLAIHYAAAEPPAEARYLQAWLRSALPAAQVDLHREAAGECGVGRIRCIKVDGDLHIDVSGECAEFNDGSVHQHANIPSPTDQHLLHEELNIIRRDPVFEQALKRMTIWTPGAVRKK